MFDLRLGEPVYTPADVWALGVILYALMRGRNMLGSQGEERLACLSFDPAKALSDEALGKMPALGEERDALVRLFDAVKLDHNKVQLATGHFKLVNFVTRVWLQVRLLRSALVTSARARPSAAQLLEKIRSGEGESCCL